MNGCTTFVSCLVLLLCVTATTPARGANVDASAIPADEYVTPRDGDLYLRGQRVRFWGGIGGFPPRAPDGGDDPHRHNRMMIARIEAYGFNMMRIWGYERAMDRQGGTYRKGDGSHLDRYDNMIALAKQGGIYLWMGSAGSGGAATPEDVGVIDEAATAAAWSEAVKQASRKDRRTGKLNLGLGHCVATAWDPRLERIAMRNTARFLSHVNEHTGLRVGDDPVFAVWELNNEQWWIVKMVSGRWQKLPRFFRDSLLAKWHAFLKGKYGDEKKLVDAWGGLKPGESLARGTIYLAPLRGRSAPAALNDANPHASAKFAAEDVKYGRDDFSPRRGSDVNEFFAGVILGHKKRMAAAFKKNGRSAGTCALLHDTGIGYNGISQLIHQNADAVSHCAYIGGWTHDETHHRYPWFSGLEEPPRICMNVPWLEHNTVEGKPYFVYETQIGAPSKYRVEFPYRILFLAAINGWDAVCWHTMSGGYDFNKEDALTGLLAWPGHAAFQFTYKNDETQLAAMHAAGKIFTNLHLEPAPNPTTFIYGRRTLYHPDNMDYAGSYGRNGLDMLNTAYRYGSRIFIDLDRTDDEIEGRTVPLKGFAYPNPVKPTDQMTYDWNRGCLTFDAPGCAAFVGFLTQYGAADVRFASGAAIRNVSLKSDPGMTHAVTDDETYVAIGLTSTDGRPLAGCRRAMISAVSTSHNTGLEVGPDPKGRERPRHVWDLMKVESRGRLPVLHTRVGCVVSHPGLVGMRFTCRDWTWNVVDEGTVGADGGVHIRADLPVFVVELEL